jgi:hypothetical protein
VLALGVCAAPAALAAPQGEEDDAVTFGCTSVTFDFTHFPNMKGNTVSEFVLVDGQRVLAAKFSFDGAEGSNVLNLIVLPGHHPMDAYAKWDTNGVRGGRDHKLGHGITCAPTPSFAIQMLQRLKGGGGAFDPKALTDEVGQTIEYAIVLPNTGNVPLIFTSFGDPGCDPGTITGGPGATPVPPGGSTTYFCTHLLIPADQLAGQHQNVVSVTADSGETGTTVSTHTSNTVVVTVPKPPPPPTSEPPPAPSPVPSPSPVQPRAAAASTITEPPPAQAQPLAHAGRLGLFSGAPLLMGQEGCARSSFIASIVAAGVARVTFSLDRHRLSTLTTKDTRGGRLSTKVEASRLTVGAHRLKAKITMSASAPAPALTLTRALTFLRCDPPVVTPKFTG